MFFFTIYLYLIFFINYVSCLFDALVDLPNGQPQIKYTYEQLFQNQFTTLLARYFFSYLMSN